MKALLGGILDDLSLLDGPLGAPLGLSREGYDAMSNSHWALRAFLPSYFSLPTESLWEYSMHEPNFSFPAYFTDCQKILMEGDRVQDELLLFAVNTCSEATLKVSDYWLG